MTGVPAPCTTLLLGRCRDRHRWMRLDRGAAAGIRHGTFCSVLHIGLGTARHSTPLSVPAEELMLILADRLLGLRQRCLRRRQQGLQHRDAPFQRPAFPLRRRQGTVGIRQVGGQMRDLNTNFPHVAAAGGTFFEEGAMQRR
jgi:hypothetical protein